MRQGELTSSPERGSINANKKDFWNKPPSTHKSPQQQQTDRLPERKDNGEKVEMEIPRTTSFSSFSLEFYSQSLIYHHHGIEFLKDLTLLSFGCLDGNWNRRNDKKKLTDERKYYSLPFSMEKGNGEINTTGKLILLETRTPIKYGEK